MNAQDYVAHAQFDDRVGCANYGATGTDQSWNGCFQKKKTKDATKESANTICQLINTSFSSWEGLFITSFISVVALILPVQHIISFLVKMGF